MAEEKTPTKKKPTPPAPVKPQFGLDALSKTSKIGNRAALRARLRNVDGLQGKYRSGRTWDFGSQKNVDAVAKQIAGTGKTDAKSAKKKAAKEADAD
jgi:hypothetical protein